VQSILYTFFIALINNIDNISVRIAYSLKGIKIDIYKNILISVITFIMSTLSAFLGATLINFVNPNMCSIFTAIIFICLGLYFIFEPHIKHKEASNFIEIIIDPNNADIDNSKNIDLKEAIFLGIALNLNNIGGSLSAGAMGINIYLIGGLSTLFSFIALWLGNYVASIFENSIIYKNANLIAGIILILIGIKQLF
jgi:putative sporulation protein YtaF